VTREAHRPLAAEHVSVVVLLFGYHTSTSVARSPHGVGCRLASGATGRYDRHGVDSRRARPPARVRLGTSARRSRPTTTVTGDVAQTQWGPVQVQITVAAGHDHRREVLQYPTATADERDQLLRAAGAGPGDPRRQSADIDMVSGATSPARATSSRCRARSTRPGCDHGGDRPRRARRYVEHVMGMPVSLALRGRHADDAAATRAPGPRRDGDAARRRPGLQHLPARLVRLPAGPRRAGRSTTARPRWPRCWRWASWPRIESARRLRRRRRPGPDGGPVLDPSGVVKGWAVERAARAAARAGGHRRLPLRRRRPGLPHADPRGSPAVADRHRGPARPAPRSSPSCRSATAPSPPRARAPRGPRRRRPHRAGAGRASPRSPSSPTT
jgi:uncharacterized protein with FMN-binding domain